MNYNNLMNIVENNKEQMINTLAEWIKIPSVKDKAQNGAPMGVEINNMLNKAIEDCKNIGLEVRNFDGYVCDARMGNLGVDPLAILAHIDVVPTGDGWAQDPFGAQIIDGKMYGRGTTDDKGPAVAALYAMKAVIEAGIPLKREVRLILGTDEESGWECIDHYKKHCELPKSGFSPDASYPVINTEKGLLRVEINTSPSKEGLKIIKLHTGERANVIPGKCEAIVEGDQYTLIKANEIAKELNIDLEARLENNNLILLTKGIPGHAAMPEMAKNAIGLMLTLLNKLGAQGPVKALAEKIGTETNGKNLGIKVSDNTSGELTLNIGIVKIDDDQVYALLDIRFPLLANSDYLFKTIDTNMGGFGFNAKVKGCSQPHHVPENSQLVQKLLQAYHDETGLEPGVIAIGGGTYARALQEGVAFGANFPDDAELAHQAGEYVILDKLVKNARIFAKAIAFIAGDCNE